MSKMLSLCLILGSGAVKLPQVLQMWRAKSGEGLSVLSLCLDVMASSAKFAYGARHGFPFSTYGESLFLSIQSAAIAFMVRYFAGKAFQALALTSLCVLGSVLLLSPLTSLDILAVLQAGNIFVVLSSKGIQAATNFTNGSTGQLSSVTSFLLFIGTLARVYTSLEETGDVILITSYTVSSCFNLIIFLQIRYYNKPFNLPHSKSYKDKSRHFSHIERCQDSSNGQIDGRLSRKSRHQRKWSLNTKWRSSRGKWR